MILNFDRPLTLQSVSTMRSAFAGERKALSRVVPTVGASAIPSERRVTSARVPKPRPAASPPKDIMRPSREAGTDRWRAISFNCLTTAHWFLLCLWYQCVVLMLLRQYEDWKLLAFLNIEFIKYRSLYNSTSMEYYSNLIFVLFAQLRLCLICLIFTDLQFVNKHEGLKGAVFALFCILAIPKKILKLIFILNALSNLYNFLISSVWANW